MSGLPARTRRQTEGGDRAGTGGGNLAALTQSCRGFPDILARRLSVFPCQEGNLRKIIQSKIGSCTQAVLRSWLEAFSACGGGFLLLLTNFLRPSEPSPLLL